MRRGRGLLLLGSGLTLLASPNLEADGSSVWLYAMGVDGGEPLRRRLDDGSEAHRIHPEFLFGTTEVFVYFNVLPSPWKVFRCRTGIATIEP
jgi:hypothetical protein